MVRIVLIGPIRPYRGGIAHSNTMLGKNLSKKHDVLAISFSRLFPKLLYPGKFQKEKGRLPEEFITVEEIDSLNPLTWKKAVKRISEFKADVVVFQWWTTFLVPCYLYISKKLKGKTKIVAFCHNIFPHEKSIVHSILAKLFLKQADRYVTLLHENERNLKKIFPRALVKTIVEPVYAGLITNKNVSKPKAKRHLGIKNKKVVLFFGFIRPYKGLRYLIEAMPDVIKKHQCLLMIVGEFWSQKEQYLYLIKKLGIEDNVKIVDQYVSNKDVHYYFNASDVIVLPYISGTNSGIIMLAYHHNTPVITTTVGGNPELIEHGKSGLLVESKNSKELTLAINKFYNKRLEQPFKKEMKKKKKMFQWSKEKEKIVLGEF